MTATSEVQLCSSSRLTHDDSNPLACDDTRLPRFTSLLRCYSATVLQLSPLMIRADCAGTTTSGSAATSNYALCWLLVMACGITFRLEQPTTLAMRPCLTILQHEPGHRIPGAKSYRSLPFDSTRLFRSVPRCLQPYSTQIGSVTMR